MSHNRKLLTAIAAITALASIQPGLAQADVNAFVSPDEKWNQLIRDGQSALDNDKATPAIGVFKRALTQVERGQQSDQNVLDRMKAISNVKLGKAYAAKGDYLKADLAFKDAKAAYTKLAIEDAELQNSLDELAKHYKAVDPNSLGDSVTGYLKEANVSNIAIFMKDEGDLVEITLPQKFVKPIDSKDVPKVSFSKKVSFQFLTKANGDYQVSKIQGMQVLAKTLWVNLLESLIKVGTTPVAEVTAGKMGVTKTVTVNIPTEMYNSTKQILDKMIATIKGQPAYAAETETSSSTGSSPTAGNSAQAATPIETEASSETSNVGDQTKVPPNTGSPAETPIDVKSTDEN